MGLVSTPPRVVCFVSITEAPHLLMLPTISVKQISLPKIIIVKTLVSYFLLTSPGLTTTTRSQLRPGIQATWADQAYLFFFNFSESQKTSVSFSG